MSNNEWELMGTDQRACAVERIQNNQVKTRERMEDTTSEKQGNVVCG